MHKPINNHNIGWPRLRAVSVEVGLIAIAFLASLIDPAGD